MRDRVTLEDLKAIILDQADMTGSSFISDERLQYWVNAELRELYDLLVGTFSDYFIKRYQATFGTDITSNFDRVPLPDDFFKLAKVFYLPTGSTDDMYTASRIQLEEIPRYQNHQDTRYTIRYYISNGILGFVPDPGSGDAIDMWYVPEIPWLRNPSDTVHLSVPVGWEDFVVAGCVARCLAKEESDPSFWLQRKAYLRQHIIDMAEERDEGQPARVVDAYNRFGDETDDEWLDN